MPDITIVQARAQFLESIKLPRSTNTIQTYNKALEAFLSMLADQQIDIVNFPVTQLTENSVADFVTYVSHWSPSTESLYLQVIKSFFEFIDSEHLATINLSRIRMLIRQRGRRSETQSEQYPENDMKQLIEFMSNLANTSPPDGTEFENMRMRNMRDRALILTLADTGLRVDEVCKLHCGDLNWSESRAILNGRGNKQAYVRFSTRALDALRDYLTLRAALDMETGRPLLTLPLFARHDKGAGKKIQPITTTTIRNIVADRVHQFLGSEAVGKITPHTFLHYFVTTILRKTGNLKLAQVLARHTSIQVTQKYAHIDDDELDKGYYEIFEKKDRK